MNYWQAVIAYVLWGIFPVYWKYLSGVNALEVICHRIIWALLTLVLCISLVGQWREVSQALRDVRRIGLIVVAACLISCNWLVFIWAVTHGAIVESSLGYFINPLMNVLLGVLVFGERLKPIQWAAVLVAALGLVIMTASKGSVSWIALALASSFALYAVAKKKTSLPAIAGLGLETAVLMPLALLYLFWYQAGSGEVKSTNTYVLLMLGGPITTVPLVLFAAAAKTVPLVVMGMLQYIAPSMQFLIGIWLYREPLDLGQLVGFGCVWSALVMLTIHAIRVGRSKRSAVA